MDGTLSMQEKINAALNGPGTSLDEEENDDRRRTPKTDAPKSPIVVDAQNNITTDAVNKTNSEVEMLTKGKLV